MAKCKSIYSAKMVDKVVSFIDEFIDDTQNADFLPERGNMPIGEINRHGKKYEFKISFKTKSE